MPFIQCIVDVYTTVLEANQFFEEPIIAPVNMASPFGSEQTPRPGGLSFAWV
jgi:hypothetical protein